jgi:uncharacterized membrane protein
MHPSASAAAAALLLVALPTLTGCDRGGDEPAAEAAGDPAAPAPSAPPADAAPADVPPPAGVLRAYVWECDGGITLRMKNLYRENAITLEMHEGPRRLPQVVSASGAKYSDGSLTFWTKGDTATFERQGGTPVHCRELRAQSLLADASARGVLLRGIGNEPGWTVEVGPGTRVVYVTGYGQERHEFESTTTHGGDGPGPRTYLGEAGADRIRVTVAQEECQDDMSGETFDHRMVVEHGGRSYRGCAVRLQ